PCSRARRSPSAESRTAAGRRSTSSTPRSRRSGTTMPREPTSTSSGARSPCATARAGGPATRSPSSSTARFTPDDESLALPRLRVLHILVEPAQLLVGELLVRLHGRIPVRLGGGS